MSQPEGDRTPKMRRGRERLTVRNPRVEKALASLVLDDCNVEDIRSFGNKLQAAADAWLMRGGFGDRGRIDKSTAHRMLVSELRKVGGK